MTALRPSAFKFVHEWCMGKRMALAGLHSGVFARG
jgi:hypothetical protein